MLKLLRKKAKGFTLIELLIVVAIIGILAAIAIPNLMSAQRKAKYSRAAADTKTAVTQAIVYQNDKSVYPGTLNQLQISGYANVPNNDPWGHAYVPSALFADTANPPNTAAHSQVHVCSGGAGNNADGNCAAADMTALPAVPSVEGSVGYSATYGSWQPS